MTIERILGTDTGKEAFYKADRNFVALEKRPILNKAAAYTVVADDLNKTITVTGETTITLTAIATLGLGFRCRISNIGTGIISIVPSGTDTIATGTGITIYPGKCVEVVADYAGMWTVVGFDFTEVVNSLGAQINTLVAQFKDKVVLVTEPYGQLTKTTVNLGFKPKLVNIMCAIGNTKYESHGNSDGVVQYVKFSNAIDGTKNIADGYAVYMCYNTYENSIIGAVVFTDTGIEITWTAYGTLTGATGNRQLIITATSHQGV